MPKSSSASCWAASRNHLLTASRSKNRQSCSCTAGAGCRRDLTGTAHLKKGTGSDAELDLIVALRWCYVKDTSGTEGADSARIDNLSLVAPPAAPLNRELVCLVLDLSLEDCELITSAASEPASPAWYISYFASEGETSLRSAPAVTHNQTSCLVLGVSLSDHHTIRFFPRTDSEGGNDFLYFEADGIRLIENFSAEPGMSLRDFEPLEVVLAGSGDIDDGQTSCLVLGVTLPDDRNLRFSLRTDSEAVNDFLYFEADGTRLLDTFSTGVQSASVRDWEQMDVLIAGSVSSLTWCYTKNGSTSTGEDSGWLDALSFTVPGVPKDQLCTALDMNTADCALIRSISTILPPGLTLQPQQPVDVPWSVATDVSHQGSSSLRSGDIGDSQASCLVLEVTLPAGTPIRFALRASAEGLLDHLTFAADSLTVIENFSLRQNTDDAPTDTDFEPQEYTTLNPVSHLSWCYRKDSLRSRFDDSVWLDALIFTTASMSFAAPVSFSTTQFCIALDLSADNCSQIQSVSFDPSSFPWQITTDTSVAGGSSLRSGEIGGSEQSCLVLELTLPVNSVISVAGRTSSEPRFDRLQIDADNLRIDTISAANQSERDWRQQNYFLPTAISALRWCYTKDGSDDRGQDAAWIDNLSFSTSDIPYQNRICAALDLTEANCSLIESVSYEPPELLWVITSATSVAGGSSLRSGGVNSSQQSCIVLELTLPVNSMISVAGRTSSEGRFDQLQMHADNLRLDTLSAPFGQTERGWRLESYFLPTAISTLSWCYDKRTGGVGEDAAWIDNLSFSTSDIPYQSRICAALDVTDNNCSLIQSVSYEPPELLWVITSQTSVAGRTSLRSGDIDHNQSSCIVLGVSLPADTVVSVAARTSSEANVDQLQIRGDELLLDTISAAQDPTERDWRYAGYTLSAAISTLSWCYEKDNSDTLGQDAAWIDALAFVSSATAAVCEPLDLSAEFCGIIQSVTYEPPQNRWQAIPSTGSLVDVSALVTPPLDADQSACLVIELASTLPPGSQLIFSWRTTAASDQDMLQFQAGSQQRQIGNVPEWQTEYIELGSNVTTLSWCYTPAAQDSRAWLDGLVLVTPANRYRVEITVIDEPVLISTQTDTFRYSVEISVESPLLPPPTDWVLLVGGIENIVEADSTFALSFGSSGSTEVVVVSTPENPLLPATILLALVDRPSFSGATGTSIRYSLTAREVDTLQITVPSTATQTAAEAPIEIAVEVRTADRFDRPFNPEGLTLNVENLDNLNVPQSSYALIFEGGVAQTTITVELITGGVAGRVEVSVISGEINATASVVINPIPPELASITLSAVSSSLVQTMANTPVMAELILTALDNYGNPIGGDEVIVQLSASLDAIVASSLTVAIETSGTTRQLVEILPQNDLDTTLTVQLSRGTLDEAVELLPEGGIQISVRALRVLRQLQLSLADEQSPLRQIDPSLPIRANIRLAGLDQYDQPIAFSSTTLTAAAVPMETTATLSPQQLSTTGLQGAVTVLEVVFLDTSPENTTITIAIASPSTGVTTQDLIIQALPDLRDPILPLNIDTATDVTELDLIVALRWLADQESSTQTLVANLAITSTGVMAAGIDNLQQLFNVDSDRIDLNGDERADQLDLRILLRYMSGLRGSELAEQGISENTIRLIRLLLGR